MAPGTPKIALVTPQRTPVTQEGPLASPREVPGNLCGVPRGPLWVTGALSAVTGAIFGVPGAIFGVTGAIFGVPGDL